MAGRVKIVLVHKNMSGGGFFILQCNIQNTVGVHRNFFVLNWRPGEKKKSVLKNAHVHVD